MIRTVRLLLLSPVLFILACSGTATVKETPHPLPVRPWGMIGAKIVDTYDGVTVTEVVADSTAAHAGIKSGDILVSVNGRPNERTQTMIDYIRSRLPGTELAVEISRKSRKIALKIATGEYPFDEQLWLMAQAAGKSFDFERALALCDLFRARFAVDNRFRERVERLGQTLAAQLR